VTPDGDPVDVTSLARGDSLRVKGRTDQGFVVAERLTVSRRVALDAASSDGEEQAVEPRSSSEQPVAVTARPAATAPRVRAVPGRREPRGQGKARGGGRGGRKDRG
jgi:hypothetical protein